MQDTGWMNPRVNEAYQFGRRALDEYAKADAAGDWRKARREYHDFEVALADIADEDGTEGAAFRILTELDPLMP